MNGRTNISTDLKDRMKAFIHSRDNVSFAEIQREFKESFGNLEIHPGTNPSIIIWHGLSKELADSFESLVKSGEIIVKPCSVIIYFVDGAVPRLPLAKRNKIYKTKHWLPVILCKPDLN